MRVLSLVLAGMLCPPLQDVEPVSLRWKVPEGRALGFRTALRMAPSAGPALSVDMDAVLRLFRELAPQVPEKETAEAKAKMKELLDGLKMPETYSMTTVIRGAGEGALAVLLVGGETGPVDAPNAEMAEMLKKMQGGVQLRGTMDPSGKITSWWLEGRQKNLLALFCELPWNPVKVGDRWSLDVNLVTMGHGFVCDKAERVNRVELAELRREDDGSRTAVLDYVISESVEGAFQFGDKTTPSTMAMSFVARGRFSVEKGAWRSFSGRLRTKSTGMMSSDATQEFALVPLASVPDELLKLK